MHSLARMHKHAHKLDHAHTRTLTYARTDINTCAQTHTHPATASVVFSVFLAGWFSLISRSDYFSHSTLSFKPNA